MYNYIKKSGWKSSFKFTILSTFIGLFIISLTDHNNFIYNYLNLRNFLFLHLGVVFRLLIMLLMISCGIITDFIIILRKKSNYELTKSEQLKIIRATMNTVQDIVNNSFNSLQIIRVKAETGEEITKEDIITFDYIIQSTSQKINSIKNYKEVEFVKITSEHTGIKVRK